MERKKYIVRATADVAVTVETSTPEYIKELLESVLGEICDEPANVRNISIEEQSNLPDEFKLNLYRVFTGRRAL